MKHRFFSLALVLLLLCAMTPGASADILWEPYGDPAYDYEAADTVAKVYIVPEGSSVDLYRSPTLGGVIRTMEAGTRVYVGFTQEFAGEVWGVGYPMGDYEEGWFRIARLQREYDHELFCEDFQDSFVEYQGQLDGYEIQEYIQTYTYPGSGITDGRIYENTDSYPISIGYVYVDSDGGEWGYVGYHMGHCGWVYLDDPENPDAPVNPQTPPNTVTETGEEEAVSIGWILALIAVLVLATALIVVFVKRKKRTA